MFLSAATLRIFIMKYCSLAAALLLTIGCATTQLQQQSTAQLKLRRNQLVEEIDATSKMDIRFGKEFQIKQDRSGVEKRLKEKAKLEQELLRRWQAGDKEAYLKIFEQR
jgi:hypothetical protein